MEGLCGNVSLWDAGLTWTNNSWPQFTDCFLYTVLQWLPCGWLWLATPFYLYHLLSSEKDIQPIRYIFCAKMFCSLILVVIYILDVIDAVDRSDSQYFNAELQAAIVWIFTIILHSVLVVMERSRGVMRSPVLFIFWIISALATIIMFYTSIELQWYEADVFRFGKLCVKYGSISILVFLNCFATYYKGNNTGHNPEVTASVLSWITFAWLDRLMLKGFKLPLKSEDIYNIHPRDECGRAVNKFLKKWEEEKQRKLRKTEREKKKNSYFIKDDPNEKTPLLSKPGPDKLITSQLSWNAGKSDTVLSVSADAGEDTQTLLSKISLFKTLVRCYWLETISSQWGMVTYVIMNLVSPIVLGWLIDFAKDPSERTWHGYVYAVAFIATKMLYTAFSVMAKYLTNCLAIRIRSAGISAVFRKALIMSSEARKDSTVGEIVNLMSVDMMHIEMMVNYSFWMWISIVFLVLGIYFIYTIIGIALLAGLGFVFLIFALNFWVMHKMREYQDKIMIIKDERVKVINEVLNGIKVIKLYGWEPMFIEKIKDIRERELHILFKYAILDGFESFAWLVAMFWMMFFMLMTFVFIDDDHFLDANTSFLTLNYIDVLKLSINIMPIIVKDWIKAANSVMRLNKYLNSEDLKVENLLRDTTERLAVKVEEAHFAWEKNGPCILKNINLAVEPGKLVAIVGTVGAGKSSLLSAVLGEMHKLKGHFNLNSTVAYVSQQAWIQNNTVKDNILFGKTFDADLYHKVIDACALQADLDIMAAGDMTEIGEKMALLPLPATIPLMGINLSGGQKQRVSLARAVYNQADIYLMDDPLSAVDSHVGRHIFDHVLSHEGLLNTKTRILVTHGIQWLQHVDYIYVMDYGQISESGSYEELISHNGAFAKFLTQYLTERRNTEVNDKDVDENQELKTQVLRRLKSITSDSDSVFSPDTPALLRQLSEKSGQTQPAQVRKSVDHFQGHEKKKSHRSSFEESEKSETPEHKRFGSSFKADKSVDQSKLISEEEAAGGKVKWAVYFELMKGMGVKPALLILCLIVCYHATYNFTNIWLADWNDDIQLNNFTAMPGNSTAREDRNTYYIAVFAALGVAQTIFVVGYSVILQVRHIAASRKLHGDLLDCIMRTPMSFFDTTPIGRILNRFSQDIETLDNDIFLEAEIALDNFLRCIATCIVISYTMPIFLAVVVPVLIILYFVQQFYIRTSCQIRRIASNNRSPVFAHFSETLSGVSVIRAYQAQDRFINDSQSKIDNFQKANSASRAVNKWLETRLDALSYVIVAAAGIFAVISRENLSPGLVGLAVTYALRVSSEMNMFTILFGELETHIVSVERIREYSVVKSEASWVASTDSKMVEEGWPSQGKVQFVNYSTRYRDGLDLVLKGINCSIKGGEKVGIVGRTGAGKSSMVLSLFRLIEAAGGKIIIDGVDIAQIGLHALRRKLTILPQDPVLFAGSLRMNLDPFHENSDSELWTALEHSHLKSFVETLPQKLDHEVGEGGENLSMGQRQLVCLARTLLRKTKILILDEATAAVDMETDDLIQKTIRKEFSGCTILTIAHRLNTIMDYDRILVLDKGMVAEFDTPKNLMSEPNSIFFSMVSQTGITKSGI